MLGDHWIGCKGIPLEASARVPMIVCPPITRGHDQPLRGSACDRLVCLADLLPTCLKLGGVDTPNDAKVDGIDLLDLVHGQAKRERLFISFNRLYGLIEGTYKYIYSPRDQSELLFDLAKDPLEQHELIRSGQSNEAHQRMRVALTQWLSTTDPETVRDGQLVPVGDPPTRSDEVGRQAWPGLHTRFEPIDVTH